MISKFKDLNNGRAHRPVFRFSKQSYFKEIKKMIMNAKQVKIKRNPNGAGESVND